MLRLRSLLGTRLSLAFAFLCAALIADSIAAQDSIVSRRTKRFEERNMSREKFSPQLDLQQEDTGPRIAEDDSRRTYSIPEPWMNERNERLAAISGDRTMTLSELNSRIKLVLDNRPPITHPDPVRRMDMIEGRKAEVAEEILENWAESATLAQEAEIRGYTVTNQEIEETIAKLSAPPPADFNTGANAQPAAPVQAIGIPLDQLRAEARDSILIEKFINEVMKSWYTVDFYRQLFQQNPSAFLIPPRVRAFHIFRIITPAMTEKEKKKIRNEMQDLRKELRKKNPDFVKLVQKSDADAMLSIGDMGWISADNQQLHPLMHRVLFGLKTGETSEVFEIVDPADKSSGAHILRILGREEGSSPTLEDAMPQLQNYTFAKTKLLVYAQIAEAYDVATAATGLLRTRQVTKEEYDLYKRNRLQAKTATPSRPAASPASRAVNTDRENRTVPKTTNSPESVPPAIPPVRLDNLKATPADTKP